MTPSQRLCVEAIEEAFTRAEKHFNVKINRVPVTFSNRMTACAGKAMWRFNSISGKAWGEEIRLSNVLLEMNGSRFILETPAHEAAHIIAMEVHGYKAKGHGTLWKEVMAVIGLEARRCHSFQRPASKTFNYEKDGVTKPLTIIRHNKLQRGKVEYYRWKDGTIMRKEDYAG